MAYGTISFGSITDQATALAKQHWRILGAYAVGSAALELAVDQLAKGASVLPVYLAGLFAQYMIYERIAVDRVSATPTHIRRYGAFIGANILTLIGIGLGMVLLIIPGVIFALRWAIVGPIIASEQLSAIDALRASWDRTKGHGGAIFLAYLVLFILVVIAAVPIGLTIGLTAGGESSFAADAASSLGTYLVTAFSLAVTAAIYRQLSDPVDGLSDVFA